MKIILTLILMFSTILLFPSNRFKKIEKYTLKIDSIHSQKKYKEEIEYLDIIASEYRYLGEITRSDSLLFIINKLSVENNLSLELAECYNSLAINHNYKGNLDSSIICFKNALPIYKELKDNEKIAIIYENLGLSYKDNSNYKTAMEMQFKALEIREKYKFLERLPSNYMNIGTLYYLLENPKKQKHYLNKAYYLSKTIPNVGNNQKVSILYELGLYYKTVQEFDSAKSFYKRVVKLGKEIEWDMAISAGLGGLANLYLVKNELDSALVIHKEAYDLEIKIGNSLGAVVSILEIADIYRKQNNYTNSLIWLKNGEKVAKENKFDERLSDIYEMYSAVYSKTGKYKEAYEYLLLFYEISSEINSTETKKFATEIESKYQNEIKEQKIELLSKENSLKSMQLKFTFIVSFFILLISIFLYRLKKRKDVFFRSELEQKLLKSMMNPHFIFNALASIQNFMLSNEPKKASNFLSNFSSLSRAILTNSSKEAISLEEEIKMTTDYLTLEKMRKSGGFDYNVIFDEEEDIEYIQIPPMMIQPFIENAIKHGLSNITEKGQIDIKFTCLEKLVQIEVTDNGIGIDSKVETKDKTHKSMAMDIFKKRVVLLEKKYKTKLKYSSTDLKKEGKHGTKIYLELPIVESAQ